VKRFFHSKELANFDPTKHDALIHAIYRFGQGDGKPLAELVAFGRVVVPMELLAWLGAIVMESKPRRIRRSATALRGSGRPPADHYFDTLIAIAFDKQLTRTLKGLDTALEQRNRAADAVRDLPEFARRKLTRRAVLNAKIRSARSK
jgi:hypothetical protein